VFSTIISAFLKQKCAKTLKVLKALRLDYKCVKSEMPKASTRVTNGEGYEIGFCEILGWVAPPYLT